MNRDYFAEMYVAGVLADAGWHVYFPRRDQGFDFIVTKAVGDQIVIRPVQVKGKYPTDGKGDRQVYGYMGRLSQVPFFATEVHAAPMFTAYLPPTQLRRSPSRESWYRVFPAGFSEGTPYMRPSYTRFFDTEGIRLMESSSWSAQPVVASTPDEDAEGGESAAGAAVTHTG